MLKRLNSILCGLILLLHCSCSNYVYAPAVLLSHKPLQKGAFDLRAGVGELPKVKPNSPRTTEGGIIGVGYGFTKNINMYVDAWSDLSGTRFWYKAGISTSSRVCIWSNERAQLIVYPKVAALKNGEKFDAFAFQLSMLYLRTIADDFYGYWGIAGVTGTREIGTHKYRSEKVYGAIGHFGLGYQLSSYFRVALEVNPIYQYNYYYEKGSFILSPTFAIGYLIGMSSNEQSKYQTSPRKKR
jgi:hypothetical protein